MFGKNCDLFLSFYDLFAAREYIGFHGCILTPYIAGSKGREVNLMGEYMVEEYIKFVNGEPSSYNVTEEMLKTMA